MIAYLRGKFINVQPTGLVVDVNGIGYDVQISLNTYTEIQGKQEGMLHTLQIIREDAHVLYGFYDIAEKNMFAHLYSVSGVGASTARMVLSSMKPAELQQAIIQANEKLLESIKGIGKKTAQRIVLELQDKLLKNSPQSNISALSYNTLEQDSLNALVALGIARPAAEKAIRKVTESRPEILEVQDLIKAALQVL